MPPVGGSIESLTLNGRTFPVASDAESQRKLGGFENEMQSNGDGSARMVKTRVTWSLDGLTVSIDDDAGDLEFLQGLSDGNTNVPISISYASGETYQGTGQIVAELQASSQNATAAVALMGPGKLTKQ